MTEDERAELRVRVERLLTLTNDDESFDTLAWQRAVAESVEGIAKAWNGPFIWEHDLLKNGPISISIGTMPRSPF